MRQTFTVYEQDLDLIAALQRQVKRAAGIITMNRSNEILAPL